MPVTNSAPAPYAPTSVILSLLDRHRQKGLPTPVTADVLARAGVTDSLNSRTLQALQALDLIDGEGRPSSVFEGLRLAPETEYKDRMVQWLSAAYADALKFVDPATATETQVRDAFRSYTPVGQQDRMVSLFLGLFEAAGVAPERKKKTAATPQNGSAARPVRQSKTPPPPPPPPPPRRQDHGVSGLPPAISGLLASLPQPGNTWAKTERDRFVTTFEAVLDFCYPVTTGTKQNTITNEEEDE